jgi:AcrR family transcriptional regulator
MPAGRPRLFDLELALDEALNVFWRKGYEGTSLTDLTKAMQVNRPSLYAAFGNKEALFRKAIERYEQKRACYVREALDEPDTRAAVEKLLKLNIELITDSKNPHGCFMVQGALACGDAADVLKCEMAKRRSDLEALLRKRFVRAVEEGDLPASVNPADLARYVSAISHGLAVQAAGGATRAQLMRVAKVAMEMWPGARGKKK